MLSKLLRHEFRATGRILLPLYLLLFVTAGLFHVSMRLLEDERIAYGWPVKVFSGISTTAFIVAIIGVSVLAGVLMVYRFYKNLMTDEGYLMFTLPVTTHQIITSKLIVTLVWTVATVIADALAVALAMCRMVHIDDLQEIWDQLRLLLGQMTTGDIIGYSIELVLATVFGVLASILVFYAAIALGHSFANHKILLSVVFYFAFTTGLQIIQSIISVAGISGAAASNWEKANPLVLGHWGLIGITVLTILQAAAFYLLTNGMLKNRLNLQ